MLSAKCEAAAGKPIAAAKMLEAIDETDDEAYAKSLWLAAGWLIDANQFDQAQQKLERILQLRGDQTRVHRKLALILNNQGRRIEAAEHLRALARSGEIRENELVAMYCYSEPFIDESMPKPDFGDELLPAVLMQAKLLRINGPMEQARSLTQRLAEAFPESTQISAFLGRSLRRFSGRRSTASLGEVDAQRDRARAGVLAHAWCLAAATGPASRSGSLFSRGGHARPDRSCRLFGARAFAGIAR